MACLRPHLSIRLQYSLHPLRKREKTMTERRSFLDTPCALCGEALGKHVAPAYGSNDERVEANGLICPPKLSDDEKAAAAQRYLQ